MTHDVERMYKEYIEMWLAHDIEKIASFFIDDCVYEDVAAGAVYQGKDGVKAWARTAFSAFPDFKIEVKSFFGAGDRAASEWIMSGTHSGDFPGLPATGRSFSVLGASIIELQEDQIIRNADYWDSASMLRQLGAMPEAPSE